MRFIFIFYPICFVLQESFCSSIRDSTSDYHDQKSPLNSSDYQAIIGGTNGRPDLWNFMAELHVSMWALDKNNKLSLQTSLCGGSIINSQYILTAAHCLKTKHSKKQPTPKDVKIKVGDYTIDKGIKRIASRIIIHKKYRQGQRDYDLALIKVDIPFPLKSKFPVTMMKIASPSEVITLQTPCLVAGWGCTKYDERTKVPSDMPQYLQELPLQYFVTPAQKKAQKKNPLQPLTYFCGINMKDNIGACNNGDSGSPMICKIGNQYQQIGVLSRGDGGMNFFANVRAEIPWINATIK